MDWTESSLAYILKLNYAIAIVIVIVVVFHAIPAMFGNNGQPELRSQIASGLGKLGWVGKPDQ